MNATELERVIAWAFPFRRKRRGRLGSFEPHKKAVGANQKFADRLGISSHELRRYRTGKAAVPKWMDAAIQGWGLPILTGTPLGNTMADGTIPVKATAYAKRVGNDGLEIQLFLTGIPPGRVVLGLDMPSVENVLDTIRAGYVGEGGNLETV